MSSPVYTQSLTAIRAALKNKEYSATELTTACLQRIEATEPQINACITVCATEALAQAQALDAHGPDPDKKLWGVPIAIKDALCTQGIVSTGASKMLHDFVPFYDAHVVTRLREEGAIIIAKTNLDEFSMGASTEYSFAGASANPWNPQCSAGGSSGGSAASLMAGQAFAAIGMDTGGSIRQPASLCGCVGLKPSYGRVSRNGCMAYAPSFDQAGPMTRSVTDCALMLEAIAGYDPNDAMSMDLPVPAYSQELQNISSCKGLRIGIPKELREISLSAEVQAACDALLAAAERDGATLVEVSMPHLRYSLAAYIALSFAEGSTSIARFDGVRYGKRAAAPHDLTDLYVRSRSENLGIEVQRRAILGTLMLSAENYATHYYKAAQVRRLIQQDYVQALAHCDVLYMPSTTRTAWNLGQVLDPVAAYQMNTLTCSLNLAGLPGISLPIGLGAESALPVGIQLLGAAFDELAVLRAARMLELLVPAIGMPRVLSR